MTLEQEFYNSLKDASSHFNKMTETEFKRLVKEMNKIRDSFLIDLIEALDSDYSSAVGIKETIKLLDDLEVYMRDNLTEGISATTLESIKYSLKVHNVAFDIVNAKPSLKKTIAIDLLKTVNNRFVKGNGLVVSNAIWTTSLDIRLGLQQEITKSILNGESTSQVIAKVRKVYDAKTYQIKRLVVTERNLAYRLASYEVAKHSRVCKGMQLLAGVHRSPKCVELAGADNYGLGEGIYPLENPPSNIFSPHPNCTSRLIYVLKTDEELDEMYEEEFGRG